MLAALTLNPSPKVGEGLRVRASPTLGEWGWWGMRADCPNIGCTPLL